MDLDSRGINEASHIVKDMEIIDDKLVGNIVIREDHPNGEKLRALLKSEDIVFRTQGRGIVDKDGVVNSYDIHSVNAINKDDDACK